MRRWGRGGHAKPRTRSGPLPALLWKFLLCSSFPTRALSPLLPLSSPRLCPALGFCPRSKWWKWRRSGTRCGRRCASIRSRRATPTSRSPPSSTGRPGSTASPPAPPSTRFPRSSGSPLRPSHKRQETGLSGGEWCLLRALILRWAGRDPEGGRAAAALRRDGQQARPLLHQRDQGRRLHRQPQIPARMLPSLPLLCE